MVERGGRLGGWVGGGCGARDTDIARGWVVVAGWGVCEFIMTVSYDVFITSVLGHPYISLGSSIYLQWRRCGTSTCLL